jgi:hypothetical protein
MMLCVSMMQACIDCVQRILWARSKGSREFSVICRIPTHKGRKKKKIGVSFSVLAWTENWYIPPLSPPRTAEETPPTTTLDSGPQLGSPPTGRAETRYDTSHGRLAGGNQFTRMLLLLESRTETESRRGALGIAMLQVRRPKPSRKEMMGLCAAAGQVRTAASRRTSQSRRVSTTVILSL